MAIVGALFLLGSRDDALVADQPTTSTAQEASATEVAMGFLEAWGSFDADGAMAHMTDEAITGFKGSALKTPSAFRLQVSLLEAIGYQESVQGCQQLPDSDSGDMIRCGFDFHALGSDEIGLGPYGKNNWNFTVRDGMIVQASWTWAYLANGFSRKMWEPFEEWIRETQPEDHRRMYLHDGTDWQLSDQSIRLWERHTPGVRGVPEGSRVAVSRSVALGRGDPGQTGSLARQGIATQTRYWLRSRRR